MGAKKRTSKKLSKKSTTTSGKSSKRQKQEPLPKERSFSSELAERLFEESLNKKQRRKRRARPKYATLVVKKPAITIAELDKLSNDDKPPFQYAHSEMRGRLLRVGTSSAYVETEQTPLPTDDEEMPVKYESYHISLQTKVFQLVPKRGKKC